jgi:hypothetical protein
MGAPRALGRDFSAHGSERNFVQLYGAPAMDAFILTMRRCGRDPPQ